MFAATAGQTPVRSVPDPGVITTRQAITPAGVPAIIRGRVYAVAFGLSSEDLLLSTNRAFLRLNWKSNTQVEQHSWEGRPGLQSLRWDPSSGAALTAVAVRAEKGTPPHVELFSVRDGSASAVLDDLGSYSSGSLAVAGKTHVAAIPLTHDNALALVDLHGKKLLGRIATGAAPFAAVIDHAGRVAWVSNWGGPTAKTGGVKGVVIDARGIAASGTVSRIDIKKQRVTGEIPVGLHPTALVWDETRHRLYVANSNSDSVSVIDTAERKVIETIALQPFAQQVNGIAPTALALTEDGRKLFVSCGGINAVAQINTATGSIDGLIPAAWYPSSLALSPDEKYLAIGTLFGVGAGAASPGRRSVFAERGSVNVVELPDAAQLANYTTAVSENNRLPLAGTVVAAPSGSTAAAPVPIRSGDPTPIEHVVLIVKENRTYDQVLGDLGKGNGDPSLAIYPEAVTPNQHRLAEQFVLLDNFYATGGVSADGHQWLTQANETAYVMWPGYEGRSYPFDGTDPIAYAKAGFLWDLALKHNKTVRVYGEFTPSMGIPLERRYGYLERWRNGADFTADFTHHSPIPPLDRIMARNYPGYTNGIPDVVRAQIFVHDLNEWEQHGTMPNLILMQLNCDHTAGTTPGVSTPKAMVADNDLALGRVVEALSKSRFWPKMAIFAVEDDAQNGVDHVDGHRTVALLISPYTKRGTVDSTFYAHQSILKTIELILGLPTLSLFDLIATDMRNAFEDTPDLTPYEAVAPKQSLFEETPPLSALHGAERRAAVASSHMHFEIPDAAPAAQLNAILWHNARGWNVPYPARRSAVFVPMILDQDDGEDDR